MEAVAGDPEPREGEVVPRRVFGTEAPEPLRHLERGAPGGGLPPGEPVVRGPVVPPEGVDEFFTIRYDQLEPLSFQRVVLWGDGDMDGKKEPLAEFAIRSDDAITTEIGAAGNNAVDSCDLCHGGNTDANLAKDEWYTANRIDCETCHVTSGTLSVVGGTSAPAKDSFGSLGHGDAGLAGGTP